MADARAQFGITSKLILCFLRHLDEADAFVDALSKTRTFFS